MEPVDVLRDDGVDPAAPLELCEREMTRVGLRVGERSEPGAVEVPHLRRVGAERVDGRVLHRVVRMPDSLGRAEVGDAGLGADARAGEDDARLPGAYELGEMLDRHAFIVEW